MRLTNVRASFAKLFTPSVFQNENGQSKPRYELTLLLHKEDQADQIEMIEKEIAKAKKEKWPKGVRLTGSCFMDGDECGYDGYEGHMALKTSRRAEDGRPKMFARDTSEVTDVDHPEAIYSGAYVNAEVSVYAHKRPDSNRINGSLIGVQFKRHGERLSGAPSASSSTFDAEEPVEGEDEESDFMS